MGHHALLTYVVAAVASGCLAFNIDTVNTDIYSGEPEDFFGYKVLQFMSGEDKGVLVTAPLKQNGSGAICRYDESRKSRCIVPEDIFVSGRTLPLKHFGLSIAEDSTHSQFTVCSPSLTHECYQNSFLHGACINYDNQLQEIFNFTPAFEECTKKTVDLTFLFDGSESMTTDEFQENIKFIESIMHGLKNSSIKFAAAQFSYDPAKVFDFNDYENGRASDLLKDVQHMKDLTNTHKALKYVLKNIIENPDAGASADATKVVVIITDGDPSDKDKGIIAEYESKNIIRFVIGVKDVSLDKLKSIASHPKDINTLKISNYSGLTDILGNFEKKIFNIEGAKAALAVNIVNEMSQSGFSATYHKDTLVLGSVGSNSWSGALHEFHSPLFEETQIQDANLSPDSYAGYSISTGEWNNISLYFTGAPRYNHTGEVIFFRQTGMNWTTEERLNGEQIGSYFGAELCAVDVDSDGNTDFLLVGAPLFHHSQDKKEGLINIYKLTHELQLKREMNVSVPSRGRFGTTITSVADLNGDGLRDVAVAAPLEDNKKGAVYIYLGDKHTGIRNTYSQRIIGETINSGLQLFGQAIDGNVDLDGDGLTDIAVGSKGKVVILRSRPVFNVSAYMSFEPAEISTDKIDCLDTTETPLLMVTLTVCFNLTETTSRPAGTPEPRLNISYALNVDSMRQTKRGFFRELDKASDLTVPLELSRSVMCNSHPVYMPKCVRDTLSPISIRLKFTEKKSETHAAFLNVDSVTQAVAEVPFEKFCSLNDTCIAELEVNFEFSTPTLLVVDQDYFNVSVVLWNRGDDSYNTSLTFHYPPGLSFSMMSFVEGTRSTLHSCSDLEGVLDKTTCGVSLPVYRSKSNVTFKALFRIMSSHDWNETMSMTVIGQSDNENSTRGSLTKSIDVQYQIHLAVAVNEDSITYLNFTPEDSGPKTLLTIYEVKNLGFKSVPVHVSLYIPTKLEHNFELKNYQVSVSQNKTECEEVIDGESELCSSDKHGCKNILCDPFVLDKYSTSTFTLTGEVAFKDLKKRAAKNGLVKQFTGDAAEVLFRSSLRVGYDKTRYVLASSKNKNKDQSASFPQIKGDVKVEFIVSPNEPLITGIGVSGGLLLLIIIVVIMFKLGCFKRKTVEYYQEQEEKENDDPEDSSEADAQSQPENKPDQPAEAKPLLDDGAASTNGSPPGDVEEESEKTQSATALPSDHYANVI